MPFSKSRKKWLFLYTNLAFVQFNNFYGLFFKCTGFQIFLIGRSNKNLFILFFNVFFSCKFNINRKYLKCLFKTHTKTYKSFSLRNHRNNLEDMELRN